MNIERMIYLADQLENPTDPRLRNVKFNMQRFTTGSDEPERAAVCGTVACIGGHACILFDASVIDFKASLEVLGLTWTQGQLLFFNCGDYVSKQWTGHLSKITKEEAVAAIRRMAQEYVDEMVLDHMDKQMEVPVAVCD